jgi:phosphatidylserine synthase
MIETKYLIALASIVVETVLRLSFFMNGSVSSELKRGRGIGLALAAFVYVVHAYYNKRFNLHVHVFALAAAENIFVLSFYETPPKVVEKIPFTNYKVPGTARQQNGTVAILLCVLVMVAYWIEKRSKQKRVRIIRTWLPFLRHAPSRISKYLPNPS